MIDELLLETGLRYRIPPSLRGPTYRNQRRRWRMACLYPVRLCSYCGEAAGSTIDHVEPLDRGGADALGNMVPACRDCNNEKGNWPLLYFLWRRAS